MPLSLLLSRHLGRPYSAVKPLQALLNPTQLRAAWSSRCAGALRATLSLFLKHGLAPSPRPATPRHAVHTVPFEPSCRCLLHIGCSEPSHPFHSNSIPLALLTAFLIKGVLQKDIKHPRIKWIAMQFFPYSLGPLSCSKSRSGRK